MAEPRRVFFEREPPACPECGGRSLGPVRPEDIEVRTREAEDQEPPTAYPGVLACRRCGTIVQWEP